MASQGSEKKRQLKTLEAEVSRPGTAPPVFHKRVVESMLLTNVVQELSNE